MKKESQTYRINSIDAHSRIADFYKNRPPYLLNFIQEACKRLDISSSSVLLDLCCGRGELASQFSQFVKNIYAVDGSEKMLKNRIKSDSVIYMQHDVNQAKLVLPSVVDNVLIGSAIHWVSSNAIKNIINKNLTKNGKFLVTHTLFEMNTEPYFPALKKLNFEFGRITNNSVDIRGIEKMKECNYSIVDSFRISAPVTFGIEYLYQNQLSYLYDDFYEKVKADIYAYKKEFIKNISPFLSNKKLGGKLINWGLIYGPKSKK
jgi:SAM-dependent methyltransferase